MAHSLPVTDQWFDIAELEPGVIRAFEPHVFRWSRANMFLIKGSERDVLFDTGCGIGSLRKAFAQYFGKSIVLFCSHTHRDHVGGNAEFRDADEILVHPSEAELLRHPKKATLSFADTPQATRDRWQAVGIDTSGYMIDALPYEGFDPDTYMYEGVEPTGLSDEGDIVDIGSRRFEVLHLPGHSPGCIALWEEKTGTLFAGDAIYDGIISDRSPYSDIPTYIRTMERLRELPVRIVHGGHKLSFGRQRLIEIVDDYLASRRAELGL